jgi:RNA polymerase sigma-70 factor (ECF subfamily)
VSLPESLPSPPRPSKQPPSVARLFEAAAEGTPSSIGRLLETCRGYLLLVANREVGGDVRQKIPASDLVQESLAEAWQAFDRFSGESDAELRAWLRRILLNNLANATARLRRTAKRNIAREVSLDAEDASGYLAWQLPAVDESPSERAVASEEQAGLFEALNRLPAHYARVIGLRNLDYLSFGEVGQQMSLSADAARKLWERAVDRLANELSPGNVEH